MLLAGLSAAPSSTCTDRAILAAVDVRRVCCVRLQAEAAKKLSLRTTKQMKAAQQRAASDSSGSDADADESDRSRSDMVRLLPSSLLAGEHRWNGRFRGGNCIAVADRGTA